MSQSVSGESEGDGEALIALNGWGVRMKVTLGFFLDFGELFSSVVPE